MKTPEGYFCSEIVPIFDGLMRSLGAHRTKLSDELCVRYESSSWFVECFALARDGPLYSPRMEIGPLPEMAVMPRDKQIDIMHAVPSGSELARYNLLWRYGGPEQMQAVFLRIRDEIFVPFAVPLLKDPRALEPLVRERSIAINRQWLEQIQQHNLSIVRRKAEEAWRAKDYARFLREMEEVPAEDRSPLESQQIAYATKHR